LQTEVLSGGMILPEKPTHIRTAAAYIINAYKNVEDLTGVKFGEDYLWHIKNPEESDWYPNSEKPAIAMCVFKDFYPERVVEFAADLQNALHNEEKYSIQPETFYEKLKSEEYKEMAYYEFALMKQLQVTGFPQVLMQTGETKFHLLARGYTDYETLKGRIDLLLKELAP
jgi:putative protein-disulfide isomerase